MKLLLAATIPAWRDLAPTRWNQAYRNDLADALRHVADQICNNGANQGGSSGRSGLASLHFKLELETAAKPENEAA